MPFAENSVRLSSARRPAGLPLVLGLIGAMAFNGALAQAPAPIQVPGQVQIDQIPSAPVATIREGVAAIVNNDIISTYDLRQRILLLIVSSGVRPTAETLPGLEREARRDLIDESLQMQEIRRIENSRKLSIQPTDAEIEEEIDSLARQNNLTGPQLISSLAAAGVHPDSLRAQIRAESSWRRYVGGAFSGSVTVGEEQVERQLERVAASVSKPQYLVAEILLDTQRTGSLEATIEGAKQLVSQIQGGAPFSAVARQFSSAATAASGGDAGWVLAGDMPQQVEQALDQMRPGQLSQPIPVAGGVYIVYLRDKRAGAAATLVDLKQAAIRIAVDAPESEVEAAKAKLTALKPKITNCTDFEKVASAEAGVVAGGLGETDLGDLSPTFRDAIANLQPGQVSDPVRSEAGVHLVALCGRRAGGDNAPTRESVRDRLFEQELGMISRRELRDLRNSANIESK